MALSLVKIYRSHYAASGRTQQKTHFLTVALLQCDIAVEADRIENTVSNLSIVAYVSMAAVK